MEKLSNEEISRLRAILAGLYPLRADGTRIAEDAGLDIAGVDFNGSATAMWGSILRWANPRQKVGSIIQVALDENPGLEPLKLAAERRTPPEVEGPEAQWKAGQPASSLEKIIGSRSTLVEFSYLERGLKAGRSVIRIRRNDGSSGTAFLTANDLAITNNHVLPDCEAARSAVAQANYQRTVLGTDAPIQEYPILPDVYFQTCKDEDWTAVKVGGNPSSTWGALEINPMPAIAVGDHVNIIQHPGGGPKQVSLSANVVVYIGEGRVQYLTDTLPGSSGAPVFDKDWRVVALHHSGGWIMEPNSPSKTTFYRNEGILIDRIELDGDRR